MSDNNKKADKKNDNNNEKILVIKLGALGDFIQAMGPMAAIRRHHPNAHIILMTTKVFTGFARDCGYFDDIWIDEKPSWTNITTWMSMRKKLNDMNLTRIYDLQNNDRTSFYFRLLNNPKPEWVGVANGASHQNTSPKRTEGHAFDGHVQTLGLAGITDISIDDLSWIKADTEHFKIQSPYVLLVPGSAPQHPQKRWPAEKYGRLAGLLVNMGYTPVLLGTDAEKDVTNEIHAACPQATNLTGQTNLSEIVALGRNASATIGNDTGPMHMIAPTGCQCITLFSSHSNPSKHYPKGADVHTIQRNKLAELRVEEVTQLLRLTPASAKTTPKSSTLH